MVATKGLMALTVVLTALVVGTVSGRLWARHQKRLRLWIDDICAIIAAVLFIIILAVPILISCVADHLGAHAPTTPSGRILPPSRVFEATHFTFLSFHVLPLGIAKCSILFLYKRIFRGKAFSIANWAVICLIISWMISFWLALLLECIPVTVSTQRPPGSKCIDIVAVTRAVGVSGVVTDFIIMGIPWPFVWQLQMPTRQKFAVIGVFLLGALTIAASLARCINLYSSNKNINKGGADYTYEFGENVVWVETECALAIISSCLVTMGGLLRGWTLKIDLPAWTRSFRFKYAAGSKEADKSKDNTSSYINLKDLNPNVTPEIQPKTSTTAIRDPDTRLAEIDFPVEGIVISNTFGRRSDIV